MSEYLYARAEAGATNLTSVFSSSPRVPRHPGLAVLCLVLEQSLQPLPDPDSQVLLLGFGAEVLVMTKRTDFSLVSQGVGPL